MKAELNDKTGDAYEMYQAKHFSAATKANLQDVDWRVPRVIYDKDPKYNRNLMPLFQDPTQPQASWQKYNEVQLIKQQEGFSPSGAGAGVGVGMLPGGGDSFH